MDLGLAGRRVILTGGTRGIGRAMVEAFAGEGATIATCARGAEGCRALEAAMAERGASVAAEALDVRDSAAFSAWFERAAEHLGGVDVVVSNVSTRISGQGDAMWRDTFEVDLLQHVRLAELALPRLKDGRDPSLLFIGSIAGVLTNLPPGEEAYGTMKAALVNYAGQLAARQGPAGVRVNLLSPGPILFEGGVWDQIRQHQPQLFAAASRLSALGRHGAPEEVARTAVFLSSPAASYITGANLRIDGGSVKSANF
jgi:NAD(P)-dependent dehydrogenase (short-subunit alcohol dehydrogenase family)